MDLDRTLAERLVETQPIDAAAVLEALAPEPAAAALAGVAPEAAARVLAAGTPAFSARTLAAMEAPPAAATLARMASDLVAGLLRRVPEPERLLAAMPPEAARPIRSLLRYPEGTAGALMDPEVLAIAEDHTAADALARLRERPEHAHYNLYVVDRTQKLVGALNQRELLLAEPEARIASFMQTHLHVLHADADRRAVVEHPGWQQVHSIPVIDEGGRYLGAIRYRTLQSLRDEVQRAPQAGVSETARALGDLFATGVAGFLDAAAAAAAPASADNRTRGS